MFESQKCCIYRSAANTTLHLTVPLQLSKQYHNTLALMQSCCNPHSISISTTNSAQTPFLWYLLSSVQFTSLSLHFTSLHFTSLRKSHLSANLTLPEIKRTVYHPLESKDSGYFSSSKCNLSTLIILPFTSFPISPPLINLTSDKANTITFL